MDNSFVSAEKNAVCAETCHSYIATKGYLQDFELRAEAALNCSATVPLKLGFFPRGDPMLQSGTRHLLWHLSITSRWTCSRQNAG